MPKKLDILTVLSLCIMVASIAYVAGRYQGAAILQDQHPLQIIDDVNVHVPVITLDGVTDGVLRGSMNGDARLFIQDDMVVPDAEGVFTVPADAFFVNYVRVKVPEGMHFVASTRGSKYYSVTSSQGEGIVPENRVYFATEEEAVAAGYSSGN